MKKADFIFKVAFAIMAISVPSFIAFHHSGVPEKNLMWCWWGVMGATLLVVIGIIVHFVECCNQGKK